MTIAHDNEENENDKHSAADHSQPLQNLFKPWQTHAVKRDCAKSQRWKPLIRFEAPDLLATLRNSM